MKKILKGFWIFFFICGLIVYTIMLFSTKEMSVIQIFTLIALDVLCAVALILLIRKHPVPKDHNTVHIQTVQPTTSQKPKVITKAKAVPPHHRATEEAAEEFFIQNHTYIQSLEHQAITPKAIEYGDIDSYRLAYEISLNALHTLKEFCYSSPEGKKWYDEMYHHCSNGRCKDFSLEQQVEEGYADLISNWEVYSRQFQSRSEATDFLIENGPYIRRTIINIIREEPGILQKDIYSKFDPEFKPSVIKIIQVMHKEKVLFREPYKNSFRLYLTPSILRTDNS